MICSHDSILWYHYDGLLKHCSDWRCLHIPMNFTCPYFWDKVLLLDFGETCPRFVFFIDIEGILGKIVEIYESSDFVSFLAACNGNLLNLTWLFSDCLALSWLFESF